MKQLSNWFGILQGQEPKGHDKYINVNLCCNKNLFIYVYTSFIGWREGLERVMGIEPTFEAWEAPVLPLNYTRDKRLIYRDSHHCVMGVLRTSLYSAPAGPASLRCSNSLPANWSNPRLKLGKLQFYH